MNNPTTRCALSVATLVCFFTVGCSPAGKPPESRSETTSVNLLNHDVQQKTLELTADDVAWATGWNILKFECPATMYNGMQVVVLDGKGHVLSDGGILAINHRPGNVSLLRVAFRIEEKTVRGRMSANNISGEFELPNAFAVRNMSTSLSPEFRDNMFILAQEYAGNSGRNPAIRLVALRLVEDL